MERHGDRRGWEELAAWCVIGGGKGGFFFSKPVGVVYAHQAEVMAIRYALEFCREFNICHSLLESDSTLAVGWVLRPKFRPWKLLNDLHAIDCLRIEVDCINVSHVLWEANDKADTLAKEVLTRKM